MTLNMTNKRIKLTKTGKQISVSSRGNWRLWKLANEITPEEIRALINKKVTSIKYAKDSREVSQLRQDILILGDAYTIQKKMQYSEYAKDIPKRIGRLNDISAIAVDLISKLGFVNNTIFKQEAIVLGNIIDIPIAKDIIAGCIVKEILNYYHSETRDDFIMDCLDLSEIDFYKSYFIVNKWCNNFYWRRNE